MNLLQYNIPQIGDMDEVKFAKLFSATMKTNDFTTMTTIVKDPVSATSDELHTRVDEMDFLREVRDEKISDLEKKSTCRCTGAK